MNDGLAAIAVLIFSLDHGRPVARFTLLDNRGVIPIPIAVMIAGFADGYAGSDRSDADTDFLRKGGRRNGTDNGGNKQSFSSCPSSRELMVGECEARSFVP